LTRSTMTNNNNATIIRGQVDRNEGVGVEDGQQSP
jgi:hypothetical protein